MPICICNNVLNIIEYEDSNDCGDMKNFPIILYVEASLPLKFVDLTILNKYCF